MSMRHNSVTRPALAVLGAGTTAGDALSRTITRQLSTISGVQTQLAERGAARIDRLLTRPAIRTLAHAARAAERDLETRIDDWHDWAEELLAYAEHCRWRFTNQTRDLAILPYRSLAHAARALIQPHGATTPPSTWQRSP